MLAHSFNRFYVVTKFILPSIKDLKFSKLKYDNICAYLDEQNSCDAETKKCMLDLLPLCKKIKLYVDFITANKLYLITILHITLCKMKLI